MDSVVAELLNNAAKVYDDRHKVYGDNYKYFGKIMSAMFPDGLKIVTADDWNRIGVFVQMMSKATRYANNFERGGHADSLTDNAVYSMMLAELDNEANVPDFIDNVNGVD